MPNNSLRPTRKLALFGGRVHALCGERFLMKFSSIFFVFLVTVILIPSSNGAETLTSEKTLAFQDESRGCANAFVYKINKDNTVGISVWADKERLNLSTYDKTFEIGKTNDLRVEILQGESISSHYCNDVVYPDKSIPKKLIGKSGKAIINISKDDKSLPEWNRDYKTTIILKDVHFSYEKGNDSDIFIDILFFKDVNVGWMPG